VSAQRQADDLRSRLAEAQSSRQLAQAAADAAAQERTQLLQHVAQELNRASLVEQVGVLGPCYGLIHLAAVQSCMVADDSHMQYWPGPGLRGGDKSLFRQAISVSRFTMRHARS